MLQPSIRLLSLRVVRDLVRTKPHALSGPNQKMIETVLIAHKDSQKEVKQETGLKSSKSNKNILYKIVALVLKDYGQCFPVK